jgi:hypothetical protein
MVAISWGVHSPCDGRPAQIVKREVNKSRLAADGAQVLWNPFAIDDPAERQRQQPERKEGAGRQPSNSP